MLVRARFKERAGVVAVLILSLAVNVGVRPPAFVGPDSRTFLEIAARQLQPGFWSDPNAFAGDFTGNFWSVGYPTLVALLLRLSGGSLAVVEGAQVLLGTSLAFFAWLLAYQQGRRIRLTVLVVVAFSPTVIWMSHNAGYEVVLSWLLVVSLTCLWVRSRARSRGSIWWNGGACTVAGLLAGMALLFQTKAIAVIPILLWLAWKWGKRHGWLFLTGLIAIQIPWVVRNVTVLGSPSPFASNGPYNLWLANNPDATTGGYMEPAPLPGGGQGFLTASLEFVSSQPEAAISFLMRRAVRLLEPVYLYPALPIHPFLRVLMHFLTAALLFIVVSGVIVYCVGRIWVRPPAIPTVGALAVFVGLFYAAHLPFIAEARYLAPVFPVMVVVAVSTYAFLFHDRRASRRRVDG